jgi:hypothetical protein
VKVGAGWAYPGFVDSFQFGIMRCFA